MGQEAATVSNAIDNKRSTAPTDHRPASGIQHHELGPLGLQDGGQADRLLGQLALDRGSVGTAAVTGATADAGHPRGGDEVFHERGEGDALRLQAQHQPLRVEAVNQPRGECGRAGQILRAILEREGEVGAPECETTVSCALPNCPDGRTSQIAGTVTAHTMSFATMSLRWRRKCSSAPSLNSCRALARASDRFTVQPPGDDGSRAGSGVTPGDDVHSAILNHLRKMKPASGAVSMGEWY